MAIAGTTLGFVAEDAKYTTKEVMNKVHKGGLLKKVMEGKATDAEKAKLVEYYEAMPKNKPNQGDEASFKKLSENLVTAAKAAQKGDDGWKQKLQKATNCKACHDVHK
jgi:cytochrome c553